MNAIKARVLKTRWFNKWTIKERLSEDALIDAVKEIAQGLLEGKTYFIYGYAKNQYDSIPVKKLQALKLLATRLLALREAELAQALKENELIEVQENG